MNMSDEQLLRLAAKAAGLDEYTEWSEFIYDHDSYHHGGAALHKSGFGMDCASWNPLTDDGDAFRLAVKLGLTVCPANGSTGNISEVYPGSSIQLRVDHGRAELHGDDPMAATRRAIVRAAAALVKE